MGYSLFVEHVKSEFSVENVYFWKQVEDLHSEYRPLALDAGGAGAEEGTGTAPAGAPSLAPPVAGRRTVPLAVARALFSEFW